MGDSLFKPPLTFLHLPYSQDFRAADIAVLGLPFDCGLDPTRFGPRLGPNAIRLASALTSQLLDDADPSPLTRKVIDAGDVNVSLGNIHQTFARIQAAMEQVLGGHCRPLTLGGDGAVSLPQDAGHRQAPSRRGGAALRCAHGYLASEEQRSLRQHHPVYPRRQ